MRRDTFIAMGLLGLAALLLPTRVLLGVEIAPATAKEILIALGPDATGLHITQESLPDLFALTASRIEENPKQFTIEQSYLSGRWKGGKAVIEYARDLSYTLVSIYDKSGHRQRIYSVRTSFMEHVAHPAAQVASAPEAEEPQVVEAPEPEEPRGAGQAAQTQPPTVGFEWDENKGAYVRIAVPTPAVSVEEKSPAQRSSPRSETTSTRKRRRHGDETVVASARTFTPAPAKKTSLPAPMQDAGVWLPAGEKSKASGSGRGKESVKAGNATWTESRSDESSSVSSTRKSRKKRKPSETPAKSETTVATAKISDTSKASDEWVPKSIQEMPARAQKAETARRPVETEVPSTEELLGTSTPPPSRQAASEAAPAEKPVRSHRRNVETPVQAVSVPDSAIPRTPPLVRQEQPAALPPPPPPAEEQPPVAYNGKPGPDTSGSDQWVPKAAPKPAAEPEPVEQSVKVAMLPKAAPVDNSVDNLLKMANAGKEEMPREGDQWVPKKTAGAASPESQINKEIARVQAEEKKLAAVPKPASTVVRHDVNNPEEGVLPVSSFEKSSGPMYGRHREYERRFYPGKKPKAGAPEHDFYVEEVDRKKEVHNTYYYTHQKGKAPRLVAVERHDRVSFMSNYDIDKEDKGKISTY